MTVEDIPDELVAEVEVEPAVVPEVPDIEAVVVEKLQGTNFVVATHAVVVVSAVAAVAAATAPVEAACSHSSVVEGASWQLEVHLTRGEDSRWAVVGSGIVIVA